MEEGQIYEDAPLSLFVPEAWGSIWHYPAENNPDIAPKVFPSCFASRHPLTDTQTRNQSVGADQLHRKQVKVSDTATPQARDDAEDESRQMCSRIDH